MNLESIMVMHSIGESYTHDNQTPRTQPGLYFRQK